MGVADFCIVCDALTAHCTACLHRPIAVIDVNAMTIFAFDCAPGEYGRMSGGGGRDAKASTSQSILKLLLNPGRSFLVGPAHNTLFHTEHRFRFQERGMEGDLS